MFSEMSKLISRVLSTHKKTSGVTGMQVQPGFGTRLGHGLHTRTCRNSRAAAARPPAPSACRPAEQQEKSPAASRQGPGRVPARRGWPSARAADPWKHTSGHQEFSLKLSEHWKRMLHCLGSGGKTPVSITALQTSLRAQTLSLPTEPRQPGRGNRSTKDGHHPVRSPHYMLPRILWGG